MHAYTATIAFGNANIDFAFVFLWFDDDIQHTHTPKFTTQRERERPTATSNFLDRNVSTFSATVPTTASKARTHGIETTRQAHITMKNIILQSKHTGFVPHFTWLQTNVNVGKVSFSYENNDK